MAFKMKGFPMHNTSALKNYKNPQEYKVFNMGNKPSPFEQSEGDLKEWLVSDKGFTQEDADSQIESGAYDVTNKNFLNWYKSKENKNDNKLAEERASAPVEPEGEGAGQTTPMMHKIPKPFKGNYGQVLHNRDYDANPEKHNKTKHGLGEDSKKKLNQTEK